MDCATDRDTQDFSLGILSHNEDEIIDKVMNLNNDECNYLNLIVECIEEISKAGAELEGSYSFVTGKCKVYTYYTETAEKAVEQHFNRSLPDSESFLSRTSMNGTEAHGAKKTGAAKRKAKRKPTVTSLLPSRAQVTTDARVHPYTLMPRPACRPQSSPPLPATRVELLGGAYYMTSLPKQYCLQYQPVKKGGVKDQCCHKPPVYRAFCNGNTVIEVYSPTVGRGFNPRYNSLLVEPTVQPFLPRISGICTTVSAAMAESHTFHQMAIEFSIPS